MHCWKIVASHIVTHPRHLVGATYEEVEAHMQEVADEKQVRSDRPAIGDLTFKRFYNGPARQVHGFFTGHDGKKRRFMKVEEVYPVRPELRFLGIAKAWQHFGVEPGRALDVHHALTLNDLDDLERILSRLASALRIADNGDTQGELYRRGTDMMAELERHASLGRAV